MQINRFIPSNHPLTRYIQVVCQKVSIFSPKLRRACRLLISLHHNTEAAEASADGQLGDELGGVHITASAIVIFVCAFCAYSLHRTSLRESAMHGKRLSTWSTQVRVRQLRSANAPKTSQPPHPRTHLRCPSQPICGCPTVSPPLR
jgi:hypothetical protein